MKHIYSWHVKEWAVIKPTLEKPITEWTCARCGHVVEQQQRPEGECDGV